MADDKEAQSWVDALRHASQDDSWPSPPSPSTPTSRVDESPALTAVSVAAALDDNDAKRRSSSRSRSQSRTGSGEVYPRTSVTDCSMDAGPGLGEQPPALPLTPPPELPPGAQGLADVSPARSSSSLRVKFGVWRRSWGTNTSLFQDQQQEYESMLSGSEEIYHDIASPAADGPSYANGRDYAVGPSYANLSITSARSSPVDDDDADPQARPLYDDVAARPKAPDYCNLVAGKEVEGDENLYDDIGIGMGPGEGRASVYEFIQDPVSQGHQGHLGQSIRCS